MHLNRDATRPSEMVSDKGSVEQEFPFRSLHIDLQDIEAFQSGFAEDVGAGERWYGDFIRGACVHGHRSERPSLPVTEVAPENEPGGHWPQRAGHHLDAAFQVICLKMLADTGDVAGFWFHGDNACGRKPGSQRDAGKPDVRTGIENRRLLDIRTSVLNRLCEC